MSERPLECGECKKPIKVCYTEIVGDSIVRTVMCADCPELQKRLHGIPSESVTALGGKATLTCGSCGTSLEAIRQGALLGCSACYDVFADILASEFVFAVKGAVSKDIVHRGRSPKEAAEMSPSMRLLALNDALKETLKREDYEQAALLRDQIKELTEKLPHHDDKQ